MAAQPSSAGDDGLGRRGGVCVRTQAAGEATEGATQESERGPPAGCAVLVAVAVVEGVEDGEEVEDGSERVGGGFTELMPAGQGHVAGCLTTKSRLDGWERRVSDAGPNFGALLMESLAWLVQV